MYDPNEMRVCSHALLGGGGGGDFNLSVKIPCTQTTHAKISHLVASLPTSREQVVFALRTACPKLSTGIYGQL